MRGLRLARPAPSTDARQDKPGRLHHGATTILLDEIGRHLPRRRVRRLRVLQEKFYEPLGSKKPVATNARIIAATHRSRTGSCGRKKFRDPIPHQRFQDSFCRVLRSARKYSAPGGPLHRTLQSSERPFGDPASRGSALAAPSCFMTRPATCASWKFRRDASVLCRDDHPAGILPRRSASVPVIRSFGVGSHPAGH